MKRPSLKLPFHLIKTDVFDITTSLQEKYEIPQEYLQIVSQLTIQRNNILRLQPTSILLNNYLIYLQSLIQLNGCIKSLGIPITWRINKFEIKQSSLQFELLHVLYNIGILYYLEGNYRIAIPYLMTSFDISQSINGIFKSQEIEAIARIIWCYQEEGTIKALNILSNATDILKETNHPDYILGKIVEYIQIGRYSSTNDGSYVNYAVNGLKEICSSDEIPQSLKNELKEIQNEIQPNILSLVVGKLIEKKEWKWKSSKIQRLHHSLKRS